MAPECVAGYCAFPIEALVAFLCVAHDLLVGCRRLLPFTETRQPQRFPWKRPRGGKSSDSAPVSSVPARNESDGSVVWGDTFQSADALCSFVGETRCSLLLVF